MKKPKLLKWAQYKYDVASRKKGVSQASLDFLYGELLREMEARKERQRESGRINKVHLWDEEQKLNSPPTAMQKRLAEIWIEEMLKKSEGIKPLPKYKMVLKAGYSNKILKTRTGNPMTSKGFKKAVDELLPKEKILERISKGLDNESDREAIAYAKLGAEIHGLVNKKESSQNITLNAENLNIASFLNPADITPIEGPNE